MEEVMTRVIDFDKVLNERLADPDFAVAYLEASLEAGDVPAFALALRQVAQAQKGGVAKVAKNTKLNREQLYRTLSKKGKPQFETVTKVLHSFGLRLAVVPEGHA
jgi:probable addiction module antidote protein